MCLKICKINMNDTKKIEHGFYLNQNIILFEIEKNPIN